jgi:RNA polymerase sigma factor (TIGR02999 family)
MPVTPRRQDITTMLRRSRTDDDAREVLYDLIYSDLRRIAGYRIASSRPGETLSVTSLVNEAYLKLTDGTEQEWSDRGHFLRVAARAMRQITIDYVRAKKTDKRGGEMAHIDMETGQLPATRKSEMVIALEEGLQQLALEDPRLVTVVECRFFAGLTIPETAAAVGTSERTIERDWQRARQWLRTYLT